MTDEEIDPDPDEPPAATPIPIPTAWLSVWVAVAATRLPATVECDRTKPEVISDSPAPAPTAMFPVEMIRLPSTWDEVMWAAGPPFSTEIPPPIPWHWPGV